MIKIHKWSSTGYHPNFCHRRIIGSAYDIVRLVYSEISNEYDVYFPFNRDWDEIFHVIHMKRSHCRWSDKLGIAYDFESMSDAKKHINKFLNSMLKLQAFQ